MIGAWRRRLQTALDRTLLLTVCQQRVGLAKALLVLGADPNAAGWCICGLVTPLGAACVRENQGLIEVLVANGANLDACRDEAGAPCPWFEAESDLGSP